MNIENLHKGEYITITNPHHNLCGIPFEIVAIQQPNLLALKNKDIIYTLAMNESMGLTKCNKEYVDAVLQAKNPPKETTVAYVHSWNPYG